MMKVLNPYGGPVMLVPVCKECDRKDKRIAELEIEPAHLLQCIKDHKQRIAELEAACVYWSKSYDKLEAENEELEATIEQVSELPEKWREISYKTTDAYTNLHGCADELQAALEKDQ